MKISLCEERRLEDTQNLKCEDRRFQNCLDLATEDSAAKPTKPRRLKIYILNWEDLKCD